MSTGYLLDTNVVIDLSRAPAHPLVWGSGGPGPVSISVITEAELRSGLNVVDGDELRRRQNLLERTLATFVPLPLTGSEARAYQRVDRAVRLAGRQPRGRQADLLIAATALARDRTLVTRNIDDFTGLHDLLDVVPSDLG